MGIKPVDRSAVTPATDSLDGGASLLRGLGDLPIKSAPLRSLKNRVLPSGLGVKKPPTAPGKVETKYESYKPGSKGAGGSFPATVTMDVDGKNGAKVSVKGTPNADGTLKDPKLVRLLVPFLGGAGRVGLGTEGVQSSIFDVGLTVPVGRTGSVKAETSAFAPNDGTQKGVVKTKLGMTATAGKTELGAEVTLEDSQVKADSKTRYKASAKVPLEAKDQVLEFSVGYDNNRMNARKDAFLAGVGWKFGEDRRIDIEVTTGAENGTTVQGRINIAKF